MAISLSNHEDRIKKLENNSGSYSETVLYSGSSTKTITLSQSINNFDAIVVMTEISGKCGDCRFIPSSLYNKKHWLEYAVNIGMSCITPSEDKISFNDNWSGKNTTKILAVIGLKLYYSFSYNIIYRILLRKISRLVKKLHFNLFEISSRRGGVNYGY